MFIVTSGEPDDLRVIGVYSTEPLAQTAADRTGGDVEEFELDLFPDVPVKYKKKPV